MRAVCYWILWGELVPYDYPCWGGQVVQLVYPPLELGQVYALGAVKVMER